VGTCGEERFPCEHKEIFFWRQSRAAKRCPGRLTVLERSVTHWVVRILSGSTRDDAAGVSVQLTSRQAETSPRRNDRSLTLTNE